MSLLQYVSRKDAFRIAALMSSNDNSPPFCARYLLRDIDPSQIHDGSFPNFHGDFVMKTLARPVYLPYLLVGPKHRSGILLCAE